MSKLPHSLHEALSAKEAENFSSEDAMMKEYVNHHYNGGLAPKEVSKVRVDLTSLLHDLERRKKGIMRRNNNNITGTTGGLLDSIDANNQDVAVGTEQDQKAQFMKKLRSLEVDLKFIVEDTTRLLEKKL